jgi:hypothetical protein
VAIVGTKGESALGTAGTEAVSMGVASMARPGSAACDELLRWVNERDKEQEGTN